IGNVQLLDLLNKCQVEGIRSFLVPLLTYAVVDEHRYLLRLTDGLSDGLVVLDHPSTLHVALAELSATTGTRKFTVHLACFFIYCRCPVNHLLRTVRAHKNVGPHGVIDFAENGAM